MKNGIYENITPILHDVSWMHCSSVKIEDGVAVRAVSNSCGGILMEPGHTHYRHDYHYFWGDISHFEDNDGNRIEKKSDAGMEICVGLFDGKYRYKTL